MNRNVPQPTKLYVLEENLGVTLLEDTGEGLTDGNHLAMDVPIDGRGVWAFLLIFSILYSRRVEIKEGMEEVEDVGIP
jgi:hypothetical protein